MEEAKEKELSLNSVNQANFVVEVAKRVMRTTEEETEQIRMLSNCAFNSILSATLIQRNFTMSLTQTPSLPKEFVSRDSLLLDFYNSHISSILRQNLDTSSKSKLINMHLRVEIVEALIAFSLYGDAETKCSLSNIPSLLSSHIEKILEK